MTREEKLKAINTLKISAPIMALTQEKFKDYIQTLNQIMDWLEQEPRWIPVSERLPTKEEYIANSGLFIVSDGNRTYVEFFDVYNPIKCFSTMNGFRVDRCVTAWMPLPKPYREVEE